MNTYEQLKEIIVKAVPEIRYCKSECGCEYSKYGEPKHTKYGHEGLCVWKERPIILEDVLIAVKKSNTDESEHFEILMLYEDEKDKIAFNIFGYKNISFVIWQLNKPLSEQPEETQKFLLGLLK